MLTDWFETQNGVKQGDTLSPTLFNIFINDLVNDVNALNLGIDIDGCRISILLYADDIVLLSQSEKDLQKMLDCVYNWSKKFKIRFNAKKSNIVHFRKLNEPRSTFKFHLDTIQLSIVNQYKYLGIILNEFLDYDVTAQVLSDAASRALGSIINKYKSINGLGYYTYTRLFQSGVCPILDYGSEIWGYKSYNKVDAIQNKAIRIYLGVHRFAPIAAISGDMGWTNSNVRRKVCIVRFWNRIVSLDNDRLPNLILEWDMKCRGNTWSSNVKEILSSIDQNNAFQTRSTVSTKAAWSSLHENYCNQWKTETLNKPKLCTYIKFKHCFKIEEYVMLFMSRRQCSYLAQLRCGILPLHIETGRWYGIKEEDRTCKVCKSNQIEHEIHFIFHCNMYTDKRTDFFQRICNIFPTFLNDNDEEKLKLLMEKETVNLFSRYLCDIYKTRQDALFKLNN